MSKDWYLINNRYLSGFESEEFDQIYGVFPQILEESPEAYDVYVDDVLRRVILQSTTNYNERKILFNHGDINWGSIVVHKDEKWLMIERPFYNKIYDKSLIKLCNASMKFEYETDGIVDYYDELDNPVWLEEPQIVIKEFPCAVESISELNMKASTGDKVNIPEGDMALLISYTTDELIEISNKFEIFDKTFEIRGIDNSQTKDGSGILTLIVSRAIK